MQKFTILIVLLGFFVTGFASDLQWVDFNYGTSEPEAPAMVDLSTSKTGLVFTYEIPGIVTNKVTVDGETFDNISVPGWGVTRDAGKPKLPAISRFVAIPAGASATVRILQDDVVTYDNYYLFPAQPPAYDSYDVPEPEFTIDREFYTQDVVYPEAITGISGESIIRGVKTALVHVNPIQYNPHRKQLIVHRRIQIEITFNGQGDFVDDARLRNPYFEGLYKSTYLNYDEFEPAPSFSQYSARTEGADMIILTNNTMKPAADTLAAWKNILGIKTVVEVVETVGNTDAQIKTYIQDAYDNWTPAPAFVLIIGDDPDVKSHFSTMGYASHVTDLHYQKLDGADYMPDIAMGRFSVSTLNDAMRRVQQVIQYEKDPISDPAFYNHSTHAAYFQHASGGYAERRFAQTSEEITQHLLNIGYNAERIFYTSPSVNPTHWNNGYYSNGEPIPAHLLRSNGFLWNGSATDISNAVNGGTFILTHRDHGSTSGWADPSYSATHVSALQNGDKLPVVFSLNCLTGKFNSSGTVFAEAWERNQNGGAIGVIAASETSLSGQNDGFAEGMIDAIWPGCVPSFPHNPNPALAAHDPMYRMGLVMNQGKIRMTETWTVNPPFDYDEYTYELFHWFGDPSMEIRTEVPQNFVVSHPPTVIMGSASFDVNINVDSAFVAITRDGQLIGTGLSNNGMAQISFSEPITNPDLLTMAITKPNFIPYITQLQPITASGPYLYVMNPVIDDGQVNANGIPECGEVVELMLNLTNLGVEMATNVNGTVSCPDSFLTVLSGTTTIATVDTADTAVVGSFTVEFRSDTPHMHHCSLDLHLEADSAGISGGYTWEQKLHLTIRAGAKIELQAGQLEYPNTFLTFTSMMEMPVRNTGPDTLFITDAYSDIPQFSILQPALTIAPGMEKKLEVGFTPDTTVEYVGTITVVNSDPVNFQTLFPVRGTGIFAPDIFAPDSIPVVVGPSDSVTQTISLQNLGLGDLSYNAQIAGFDPNAGSRGAGGSDTWGHMWIDSDDSNGPTFDWIDITGTGTEIALTGNNSISNNLTIGFPFTFYGTDYDQVRVCTNGWISFNTFSVAYNNFPLPNNLAPRGMIAPLWDDLVFFQDSKAYYENQGNKTVFLYENAYRVTGEGPYTFEVVLYDNGNIMLQYLGLDNVLAYYTFGIQNEDATDGLTVAHNESYLHDSLAVLISKHSWVQVSPMSGVISAQGSEDLTLTFLTNNFPEESFWASLQIESNDPDEGVLIIPIHMVVSTTGISEEDLAVEGFRLYQNSPNPFNPVTQIRYNIENSAQVELIVYNMLGQKVRTLTNVRQKAGVHKIEWDGRNDVGNRVASGIYIYRLKAGDHVAVKKMILMK